MENAQIALFEDDEDHIDLIRDLCHRSSHELVAVASTITDARDVVGQILDQTIDVTVAVLDGNLQRGHSDGQDAREIMEALGYPERLAVPVIGYSLVPFNSYDLSPTADPTKYGRVVDVIDNL